MQIHWTPKELIGFEKHVAELFCQRKIHGPIHLSGGNENQLIKIFKNVKKIDWVCSTHRYHYHYLLKGGTYFELMSHMKNECTIHLFNKEKKFITSAIVGGIIPIAVGIAQALSLGRLEGRVWCFVGDGATDSGHFFEAVRYAIDRDLPITFVIEDNEMSCDTHYMDRWNKFQDFENLDGHIKVYKYKRTYPHTGMGEWVSF